FFFSSRRRHTRFSRDWSSDVCSSDLSAKLVALGIDTVLPTLDSGALKLNSSSNFTQFTELPASSFLKTSPEACKYKLPSPAVFRSEERRVGKECSSLRSPYKCI